MTMQDTGPSQDVPRHVLAAASGAQGFSFFYAGIVFIASAPVVGLPLSGAWFVVMAVLCLIERGLLTGNPSVRDLSGSTELSGPRAAAAWLINFGFSLAASHLLYFYNGPAQTFGVTLLGVLMFRILVQDYARPRRLLVNLIPPLGLVAVIQVGAGLKQMSHHTPWLMLPTLASALLVLWVLRSLFLDLNGNLQRFWREASRAELSERTVVASERRFRMIADHGTDIVVWLGADGLIRYVSPSIRALGYAESDLIGRATVDFVHPDDRERSVSIVRELFQGREIDKTVRREYRVRDKSGGYHWLEGNPTLVLDPETGDQSCITSFRDVSARRLLEDDLIEAKVRAEQAADAKSEFLTNMSHEIRTPLTAIIGFAGLLQRVDLAPEQARTYVNRIASSGDVLLSLVNDILDFARMEQNQVQLRPAPFDLRREMEDTLAMFGEIAADRGLALELRIEPHDGIRLVADSGRLRQLVVNLVGNALKFTDRGGVSVSALFDPSTEKLLVEVRDTGVGIAPDKLDMLFQRFSQLDGSSNRRHGGTGLGLSICAKLVALMQGDISVESALGAGSCFRFRIPAPVATDAPGDTRVEALEPERSEGCRVLVVDDVAVNRELIRAMLEAVGQCVEVADSGEAAVSLAATTPFDLIFMDLQMPGIDGYAAARRIRTAPSANADTPIIALSANVLEQHRDAAERAGMNGHVAKPIRPEDLLRAVDTWSGVRLEAAAKAAVAQPPAAGTGCQATRVS
jgi:two-component system, sensor histidine kinase